jgi:hypothetical protein
MLELDLLLFSDTFDSQVAAKRCIVQRASNLHEMGLHDFFLRWIFNQVLDPSALNAEMIVGNLARAASIGIRRSSFTGWKAIPSLARVWMRSGRECKSGMISWLPPL